MNNISRILKSLKENNRKAIIALLAVNVSGIYVYIEADRKLELLKIQHDAYTFAHTGMIYLDSSISIDEKKKAWESIIKPHMISEWIKTIDNYDDKEDILSQLRQPENGKTYELTSTNYKLPNLPKLISSNYKVQSIIGYMIDPSLKLVDFGDQTHWKYRYLADPWLFMYEYLTGGTKKQKAITLSGSDQSWHITVIRNKNGKPGTPIPWATHIDGGEDNVLMRKGWPPIEKGTDNSDVANLTVTEKTLLILLHQISILFYCETPGNLGINQGSTGFYQNSHRAVIKTFRKILENDDSVPHGKIINVLRLFGKENQALVSQAPLLENQVILAFGTLVHTAMWASESMPNNELRVIQNCKIKFSEEVRKGKLQAQREIINAIPTNSLMYKLASDQLSEKNNNNDEKIMKWSDDMYKKYRAIN